MCIRKSLFAVPLVVLFLTFLYPQTGRADCPDDWWCDPPPQTVNNPFDSWGYSPGFDLLVCYDLACVASLGLSSSGLPAPNVTINSSLGCTSPTDITLEGSAICAARNDGVLDPDSVAECFVWVKLPSASCTVGDDNSATYSKFQSDKQLPDQVFDPDSKITIKVPDPADGPTGWPCPIKNATGQCTAEFFFPIGTQFCSSFNGCVAKIYPATGDGTSFDSLNAGQVVKAVQSDNFLSMRACKGEADGTPASILCEDKGNILTGGGEASVGVKCPEGDFAGNRTDISTKSGTNGFDLVGNAVCPLNGILQSSVKLNGVLNSGCKPQAGRIRCFFEESEVYAASGCTAGLEVKLVATGDISVPQGTLGTVTVPFFTDPGNLVTCK